MIKFKDLTIEGFGSYIKPITYKLDDYGINLILGHNGSGKSTLIKALLWVLYKTHYKEPWEDLKGEKWNGTKVSVRFYSKKDKVKIIRCKSYKSKIGGTNGRDRLFLYINGKQRLDLRDKPDIQKEIIKILGMSSNLFTNSVIFGQGIARFLKEKGPKQKEIFDEAFNTTYINEAKDKASKDLSQELHDLEKLTYKIESLESKKGSNDSLIQAKVEYVEKLEIDLNQIGVRLEEAEQDLELSITAKKSADKLQKQIEKIEVKIEEQNSIDNKLFRLELGITKTEGDVSDLKNEAKKLLKGKLCGLCGQKISSEQLKKETGKIKDEVKDSVQALSRQKESYKKLLSSKYDGIDLNILLKDKRSSLEKVRKSANQSDSLERYIKTLKQDNNTQNLTDKKEEIIKLEAEQVAIKTSLSLYANDQQKLNKKVENLRWLINTPLSNKGIKAYIFENRLDDINDELEKYTKLTGYRIKFVIDMESANKNFKSIIYKEGMDRPYTDLSGGQQQMVDICLIFATHAVTTSWVNINILIMDEIFESLDEANIQLVADLITMKSENICIHLMTHVLQFVVKSNKVTKFNLSDRGYSEVS